MRRGRLYYTATIARYSNEGAIHAFDRAADENSVNWRGGRVPRELFWHGIYG